MPEPQFIDAPAPKFVDLEGPKFIDAPSPKEGGILGWLKGKQAEGEAKARAAREHPVKALLTGIANIPIIQTPSAIYREVTGNAAPDWLTSTTGGEPTVGSVVKGAVDMPIKAAQIAQHGYDWATGGTGQNLATDRLANRVDALYRDPTVIQSNLGEAAGGSLIPMSVASKLGQAAASAPKALSTMDKVRMILAGAAKGVPTGAALSALAKPEVGVASNADFGNRLAEEATKGGVIGGVLGAAAPAAEIGIDAWANKFRNPEAAKLLQSAEATNVPLKPSDIIKGTQPPPEQTMAAEKAVNALSSTLKRQMDETPFSGIEEVKKAAIGGGPRASAAQAILDEIAKDPKDAENVLKVSGGLNALREKMRMDQLASARDTLAQGVKGPLTDAAAAVDKRIEALSQDLYNKPEANKGEIAALQQLKQRFLGTPATDHLVGEPTVPTFQQASATRANLNNVISGLYKGNNAVTGQADAATLQAIKNGLNSDMSRMAEESGRPALAAADKTFRSEYSKYSGTFKDPAIVKAITSDDQSAIMAGLAKAGPEKAQRVFDALDPKGQAAYAVGTFNQALKDAANPRTGDWIGGNIAMGLKKTQSALGVTIKDPVIKDQMDSTLNVLRALAKANPTQASALGQRVTGSIVEANDKTAWAAKLYQAIKDGGVDVLFNSKAGKDFLFKAKGLSPDSPAMATLIRMDTPAILASAPKTEKP